MLSTSSTRIIISFEWRGKIYAKDLAPDDHMDNCIIVTLEFLKTHFLHL
jgi:hypothetical protein